MVNEILGFREPVITQRQEALPALAAHRRGAAQPFVSLLMAEHLQHLHSFLPPLYPQMRIMANVRMKIFWKANTAACWKAAVDRQIGIYIFSQFPFVFLTQIFKIRIYAYLSTVQFYDNYFRSIVNSHWNNTVSNTSAHNHSCSILCIDACVIFREKSLVRSNNSSQKWQSKLSAVGVPRQY